MLNISKLASPGFFEAYKKRYSPKLWDDFDGEVRSELKEHILKHEQTVDGLSYCPYCEARIEKDVSHVEHIKPRSKFNKETFNYDNLLISCEHTDSCGKHKDNDYFTGFIDPVHCIPSDYFTYSSDGMINATDLDALKTIKILNLNSKRLKDARKSFYKQLGCFPDVEEYSQYLDDFPTLLNYYLENECV